MSNNPYADAAGAYGKNAKAVSGDQREIEARVLVKSANALEDIKANWADDQKWSGLDKAKILEDCLLYNRNIWLLFYDAAVENPTDQAATRSQALRNNIVNLANYIFKREVEILDRKDVSMLESIININREISAGLLVKHS
jgi:flagellar protein FlaF